jgi:hypothetical protein
LVYESDVLNLDEVALMRRSSAFNEERGTAEAEAEAERRLIDRGFSPETISSYVADRVYLFPDEEEALKRPWYDRDSDKRSFMELVAEKGDGHYAPWNQSSADGYSRHGVRRLLLGAARGHFTSERADLLKQDGTEVEMSKEIVEEAYEKLGLLAASGRNSRLEVSEVPDLLEWRIRDYDGNERVSIV